MADVPERYWNGEAGTEPAYKRYLAAEAALDGTDREALQRERSRLYGELSAVNGKMRGLRSELYLLEQIRKDSVKIFEKAHPVKIPENVRPEPPRQRA